MAADGRVTCHGDQHYYVLGPAWCLCGQRQFTTREARAANLAVLMSLARRDAHATQALRQIRALVEAYDGYDPTLATAVRRAVDRALPAGPGGSADG